MGEPGGDEIAALCRVAAEALRARGHELSEWRTDSADPSVARVADCRRCGLPVYVRTEHGLSGLAGDALTAPCRPPAQPA
jgi:hypothetical protein